MNADDFSLRDIEFHRATAAAYDADVTSTYGVYHRLLLEPYLHHASKRLSSRKALDLGCGTGVVSIALARAGFDVLGLDHSPEMLAIAEQKVATLQMGGVCRFVAGDVRQVPLEDAAVSLVTCQGLLHHLAEFESCLREMTRVLEPGGLFYISEPCLEETPLRRALRWGWRLRPGRRSPRPSTAAPKSVEAPISSDELRAALERLDLEFDMRFLTHLHPLREALPESLYTLAVRLVSWPWRHRRGDLVFVFGRRRTSPHA